ncbi:MAG: AI-2E family transporter, partial [Proteobacteria bacterium]
YAITRGNRRAYLHVENFVADAPLGELLPTPATVLHELRSTGDLDYPAMGETPDDTWVALLARSLQLDSSIRVSVSGVSSAAAAAQAILALIGFLIAGVPGALVLGIVTFLLSLIPMGPPLAWIPATAWLVWQGDYGYAIFLGIWGTFVISGVDNVLKPYLISRGGNLPLVIVLLGVFGGLLAFGFIGLFIGPTLLAVAYSLLHDWTHTEHKPL